MRLRKHDGEYYIEVLCVDGLWRRERRYGFFREWWEAVSIAEGYTDYYRIRRVEGRGLARDDSVVRRGVLATPD